MTIPRSEPAIIEHLRSLPRSAQKDEVFLGMALLLARLGTCDRKQVGAIITRKGRAISWGFNGAPPGAPHCEETAHGWLADVDFESRGGVGYIDEMLRLHGCRNATHAEANALAFAAREGISTEGGTCYVTVSPCDVCARLLIAAGVVKVVYAEEYRDARGLDTLQDAGVDCRFDSGDCGGVRPRRS